MVEGAVQMVVGEEEVEGEEREDEVIIIGTDNLYYYYLLCICLKKNAYINYITYLSKYLFYLNGAIYIWPVYIQILNHRFDNHNIIVLNPIIK